MSRFSIKSVLFVFSLLLILFNLSLLFYSSDILSFYQRITAKSSADYGHINLCSSPLAVVNVTYNCSTNISLHTNEYYACRVNYTQFDSDVLSFYSAFQSNVTVFNITIDGLINFSGRSSIWGNHSSIITVKEEGNPCGLVQQTNYSYNFSVHFLNSPPEYYKTLPNITMNRNSRTYAFFLNDYFRDIDGQSLAYTAFGFDVNVISVSISNDSQVIIDTGEYCDDQQITFMAEDPYGETALSSPSVVLTINCPSESNSDSGSGSSGSGGGGSGGASSISSCQEDWECLAWSDCNPPTSFLPDYPKGYKKKFCYDKNACDADDYEKYFYKNCTYYSGVSCYPDWECTDWTPCKKNGTQERTCVDKNHCSEEDHVRFGSVETTRFCVYLETCSDHVKNNGELGVDCGGPCEPCSTVEIPSSLTASNTVFVVFVSVLVFLFLLLVTLYVIFRRQIKQVFSQIIWALVKKAERQIFFAGKIKNEVFSRLKSFEHHLDIFLRNSSAMSIDLIDEKLYELARFVLAKMLDIEFESKPSDFKSKILALNTTKEFRKLLLDLYSRFILRELSGRRVVVSRIDEIILDYNIIKYFVYEISDVFDAKLSTFKTRSGNNLLELVNSIFLDLLDGALVSAKNKYMSLINSYESLNEQEKSDFYELVHLVFLFITYDSAHIVD